MNIIYIYLSQANKIVILITKIVLVNIFIYKHHHTSNDQCKPIINY